MKKFIIFWINTLFLLTFVSCGGNENVDLAYNSVKAGIGEYGCSNNLEAAYADLNDLSFKDAAKLTVAYWGAFRRFQNKDFHDKFCECYALTFEKDSAKSTKYFYEFLDEDKELVSLMHTNYENKDLYNEGMRVLDEIFSSALNEIDGVESSAVNNINNNETSLPHNEIQTGNMAFVDTYGTRRYYSQNTYNSLSSAQKESLTPLGVVLNDRRLSIILANRMGDFDLSWNEAKANSTNYEPEDKYGKWRLMTLSEAKHIHSMYEETIIMQRSWNNLTHDPTRISEDIGGYSIYIDHTNGDLAASVMLYDLYMTYDYKWSISGALSWYVSNLN